MITVRKYEEQDFKAIASLVQNELGYKEMTTANCFQQLSHIQKHKDYHTLVLCVDQDIVGFAGIMFCIAYETIGIYARLIALAIKQEHQHMGYGTILLSNVEKFAKAHQATDITLDSSIKRTNAHVFYERLGYYKKGFSFLKEL